MAFLDGTVITVALPTLQTTFGATVSQIQWILDSYALTLAALLLTVGTLSDNFGHKRIFLIGITLFTVGSLLCGISLSANALVWARAFQGIGGAFMIPGSLAIIHDTYPQEERGKAIGLWAGFSGGIASIGPFLGGWLTETFSWRAIFFINLPIGLLAIVLTLFYVPRGLPKQRKPLDWIGTALITSSLLLLSFGAIEAPNYGLGSPLILASLGLGIACLALFLWQENRSQHPMLPLNIFSIREVAIANIATFFVYFALSSTIFLAVLNLQQVQGLSPMRSGLGLMPPIIAITFFSWIGGKITDSMGPRLPLSLGTLIVSSGMFWLAFAGPSEGYWAAFFPGLMLFGLGMVFVIAPVTNSAIKVSAERVGIASGVNNAVSRVAALFAFALSGTVLALLFRAKFLSGIDAVGVSPFTKENLVSQVNKLAAIDVAPDLVNGAGIHDLIDLAFSSGYFWGMIGSAAMVLLAFFIVFFGLHQSKSRVA